MRDFKNLSVEDWLRIFWRRKWYFFVTATLISAGVAIYAWRLPQFYRSETRILVEPATIAEDVVRPVVRSTPEERINAIRAQIQSRELLQQLVEEFSLFGYGTNRNFVMENAVQVLRRNVRMDPSFGNIFTLSYVAEDPQFAMNVTQSLARKLIQSNLAARKNRVDMTDQFIDEQLRQTQQDLAAQEDRVKLWKTAHLGELPEQSMININTLSALNTQLALAENGLQQAQERRKMLDFTISEQRRLDALTRNLVTPESIILPETTAGGTAGANANLESRKAKLAELKTRYTPTHPDVVRMQNEIELLEKQLAAANASESKPGDAGGLTPLGQAAKPAGQVVGADPAESLMLELPEADFKIQTDAADSEIAKRQKERDEIVRQIKAYQAKLGKAPALEQELAALTRDLDALKQQYKDLQGKKFNSSMAAKIETDTSKDSYKIVDNANLPSVPVFPNRLQIILMGIGGGVLLGLGAVVGREYLDPTLRSEDEAVRALNLPVLAVIPELAVREIPIQRRIKSGVI